jgi:hypothetical protein
MRRFVPEIVWKYIQDNRLYGYSDSRE